MAKAKTKIGEIKPFKQVPSCDIDTMLSITAGEFENIQNVINAFRLSVTAVDSVLNRNINEGKIIIKYIQEDGTEISAEEATKYLEQVKQHLKDKE